MMIFVCLILIVDITLQVEGSSSTRFSLSEQIVVGRPFNDHLHQNNDTILIIDNNHDDEHKHTQEYKSIKSILRDLNSYPPIGDRSIADILAKNSIVLHKSNNISNNHHTNNDYSFKPFIDLSDSIDRPTIEGK